MDAETLAERLRRSEEKVRTLERMIEDRSRELYEANLKTEESLHSVRQLHETMPGAIIVVHPELGISDVNEEVRSLLGYGFEDLLGRPLDLLWPEGKARLEALMASGPGHTHRADEVWRSSSGAEVPMLVSSRMMPGLRDSDPPSAIFVGVDMRHLKSLEIQLRHAQKMESIGQLAAGIAHEINTPMQYINDNLFFLQDAFRDLQAYLRASRPALKAAEGRIDPALADAAKQAEAAADLDFMAENLPGALERSIEGVRRVTQIVKAVKSFSRSTDFAPSDLNEGIRSTLEIARNEYKYCAEVALDLGDIPTVECNPGEFNQVVLNLVVNAAHAIEDSGNGGDGKGRIGLSTRADGDWAVLEVSDNGCGIPEAVSHRIFDPFFTTKDVGRGTGQGLTLVHNIVVKNHGGSIAFAPRPGGGTVFTVRLPFRAPARKAEGT